MQSATSEYKFLGKDLVSKRLSRQKIFVDSLFHESVFSTTKPDWGSVKKYCSQPYDQESFGNSSANAFCTAYKILDKSRGSVNAGNDEFEPSRAYLQVKESGEDEHSAQKYGICSESSFPYTEENVDSVSVSLETCDEEASAHKITEYKQIPIDKNLIRNIEAMLSGQVPVLTLLNIYTSFASTRSGVVRMPNPVHWNDLDDPLDPYLGTHEICIVGYSHDKQLFTMINSWGKNWGSDGFCYVPYSYLVNPQLGLEFSIIQLERVAY